MGRLQDLHSEQGQSPWLDNLKRSLLVDGGMQRWIDRGIRGVTSNPSIFQKAIESSDDYTAQLADLVRAGASIEDAYWSMVTDDVTAALELFRPLYDASDGGDGYVSVEVAPSLARDTDATVEMTRELWRRIDRPNLFVKIPATAEGVPAIRQAVSEGINVNVTLIFGLDRYASVIEAFIDGIDAASDAGLDVGRIASVASFFISRVDTEVDRRLESVGTEQALALRGQAAVAQGQLAGQMARDAFAGPRWEALAARGARVQRPLWASTSTKNPAYPDTLYVDRLIGPDTVNTIPEATLDAFEDHGTLARTLDDDVEGARATWAAVGELVDLDDVSKVLEVEGVAAFEKSFDELLGVLTTRAGDLA
ncbi:MAG TPA: transaldolase [Microthrixaceae bacterium]|nr:transaldolase [Microthrixaceae bacterium]MCB9399777.1 transaldolase [Microthrixaceae bacterium]HMU80056.1 transaldolase [Microthrixaceae bacterium]HMV74818.1 transaldolase [Microthrixaceae bacterium]HMX08351.1 transaldolase [Microthrixaceae bacterium]